MTVFIRTIVDRLKILKSVYPKKIRIFLGYSVKIRFKTKKNEKSIRDKLEGKFFSFDTSPGYSVCTI